jgi:eukaryotic-like serine/threonine-protein kinase
VTALPPGSRLGRFEIAAVLGEGAMGTVYLAHDPHIDRPVALKTLRADAAQGEHGQEIKSRFLKEAKLAGRLAHPNVVTIYETGDDQGVTYIAMEYVDGESLTQWLARRGDAPYAERIEIVRQVAQALEHAHGRGVLHRDIKPGNILLSREGRVKVADFGIGKLLSGTGDLTRTGQMIGSPAYMSPEQIRGEKLDPRSDLFSLGVVLYELLTGKRPFPGDSITTLVYQILHTEPKDPLTLRADLPPSTSDVIVRLLAKSPDRRPSDAAAFLREIGRIEGELEAIDRTAAMTGLRPAPAAEPTVRTEPPAAERPAPAAMRQSGPAYVLAAAALLAAVAIFAWVWKSAASRTVLPAAPRATPAPVAAPLAPRTEIPIPTPASLPTRGPEQAADAIVGATRIVTPGQPPRRASPAASASKRMASAAEPAGKLEPPAPPAPPPPAEAPSETFAPDNVYRTRRYAKFSVSPDQARLYLDGKYVGVADDWDDRGGGKTLPMGKEGTHHVRLELPGYRTLRIDVIAAASAGDETVDIGDELKQESKATYPKIPKLDERTVGPVEFQVDPPDATLWEGTKVIGAVAAFAAGSPLRLSGPAVHEMVLSAPGRKPRTIRILVAENAGSDVAKVKVTLKKE